MKQEYADRSTRSPDGPVNGLRCPVCGKPGAAPFLTVDDRSSRRECRQECIRDYRRCQSCLATFLEPGQRPGRDAEKREYDRHRNLPGDPDYRRFLARLAEPLLERLPGACEGLDFGCGPGPAMADLFLEAGHRMSLFDPIYAPDPQVLQRQYDFITCSEVVEHMHEPGAELQALHRLLKPGGWLGIMTCFQTDDRRFADWHYRRDPTHVVFFRQVTFERIAEQLAMSLFVPRPNVVLLKKG